MAVIEIALQRDVEALILGAGAVIGEVEGLLDQAVEIDLATLAGAAARMLQHALDDVVGAPAVLGDFFEIAGQHLDRLVDLGALVLVERSDGRCGGLLQLVEQFDRQPGEVVDEVQRVLDLVGDPGGQLAERGHLLGLDQTGLRRLQVAIVQLRRRPVPRGSRPRTRLRSVMSLVDQHKAAIRHRRCGGPR